MFQRPKKEMDSDHAHFENFERPQSHRNRSILQQVVWLLNFFPLRYLIWKLPHYVTSYHQDTHVPPHFTLYNQASRVGRWHLMAPQSMLWPKTLESCSLVVSKASKTDCRAIPEFGNFTASDRHRILRYRGSTTNQLIFVCIISLPEQIPYTIASQSYALFKT